MVPPATARRWPAASVASLLVLVCSRTWAIRWRSSRSSSRSACALSSCTPVGKRAGAPWWALACKAGGRGRRAAHQRRILARPSGLGQKVRLARAHEARVGGLLGGRLAGGVGALEEGAAHLMREAISMPSEMQLEAILRLEARGGSSPPRHAATHDEGGNQHAAHLGMRPLLMREAISMQPTSACGHT